jgi:hypothetical protein
VVVTPPTAPALRPLEAPEPTHPCIRCGRPDVAAELALCEQCNPLELAQPSATQVHGIAALGIIVFVALLAVLGRLTIAGTGPFTANVDAVEATGAGLALTVSATNAGSKSGSTTCRVVEASRPTGGVGELIQTPVIQPGSTARFTVVVTKFGAASLELAVDCPSP